MEILLTVAVMYGITFSLTQAKLLNRPRDWLVGKSNFISDLLSCSFCTGFHSGWLTFLLLTWAGLVSTPLWPGLVVYAFASATISYGLDLVFIRLEGDD